MQMQYARMHYARMHYALKAFLRKLMPEGISNDEVFIALDAIADCALHSQCVDVKHAAQGFLLKDFGTLPRTLSFFLLKTPV
jgi:hypothetical protein